MPESREFSPPHLYSYKTVDNALSNSGPERSNNIISGEYKLDIKLNKIVLQVQYLGVRLSCFHYLKLRLNWHLVMEPLQCCYMEGHFENHVKVGLKIVPLVWPKE